MTKLRFALIIITILITSCNTKTLDSSQKLLEENDLMNKNLEQLRLMRNEIYAKHGYIFKSKELERYFTQKEWYSPKLANVDSLFTDIDKQNIQAIMKQEEKIRLAEKKELKTYAYKLKGCIQNGQFYLSVISIYEQPEDGIMKYDASYYLEGHYLVSSYINICDKNYQNIGIEKFKSDWISSIRIINPCSDIHIGQLQILKLNLFREGTQTLRFLKPECNDYTDNIFIEFRNGQLVEKFVADTWVDREVNFSQLNDSIFYTLTDSRDEIVGQFQTDYRYEYNNRTNKLTFVIPTKQRINWRSEALVKLTAFKTIEAAHTKDTSEIAYEIEIGETFFLDTLYRELDVLLIFRNKQDKGYLNSKKLDYKTITTNTAG